ncbi:vasoactive intestinal polypeptide receptor 2-like isoform X2 [Antennarius striatus]|uniref:vasoactive intestinal polypeptide receptor 2-like isoform X2 n=1 Tax=Antennarius striatus TaxID=241820 RepID=UPI0035AEB925
MMTPPHLVTLLLLGAALSHTIDGKFPHCHFLWEMQRSMSECMTQLQQQTPGSTGCRGEWDNVSCWQSAAVGEVMTLPCPSAIVHLFGKNGNLSRTCTARGWSRVYPVITIACWSDNKDGARELVFYRVVKILTTLGHSLSLVSLLTSIAIICSFRRLYCTRNYIHLNLFVSFILRAVAVLIKDALLFSDDETVDCSTQPSLVDCKASLVFSNYFIMANFFWLLVEGLYLHTLLLVIHNYSIRFPVYLLIGWGIPLVFMVAWIVCRVKLEDTRCWEMNENPVPRRLINWPIMASVIVSVSYNVFFFFCEVESLLLFVFKLNSDFLLFSFFFLSIKINFILFISIIRILVQKVRCTDVGGNEQSQYKRLAKSTLLLIPLFGINYVVFVYLMEPTNKTLNYIKIFFELGLGSFQGLIVAVLYCFLNSEVQIELRRMWRHLSFRGFRGRDYRMHTLSVSRNGTETCAPSARHARAQSILQTETTTL